MSADDILGIIPPGLPVSPLLDAAPAINACLADPSVITALLPEGVFGIMSSIVIPSGKNLKGAGASLTRVVALPLFNHLLGSNGLVYAANGTTDVTISDLTLDGGKVLASGTIRLTGYHMRGTRFLIERADSTNCTGYGHFSQGDPQFGTFFASGTFRDCRSANCQIAFEQMASDGVLLDNCHATDGDGDLIGTYFHPLSRSRDITYLNCTGRGNAFVGVEIITNEAAPMERLRIIGCTFEMTGPTPALVQSGSNPMIDLELLASRFVSGGGAASTDLTHTRGTAVQCIFDGGNIGSTWSDCDMSFTNCRSIGRTPPSGGAAAYGINVVDGSVIYWSGGMLEAYGPISLTYPTSVAVGSILKKAPDVRTIPAGPNTDFSAANLLVSADRTNQNLSSGPPFAWNSAEFDTDAYFSGLNPTRLTVPKGVLKAIITANAYVQDLLTTATVQMSVVKNGSVVLSSSVSTGTQSQGLNCCSGPVTVTAGDYYEVWLGVAGDTSVTIKASRCNFAIQGVQFA